MLRGTQVPPDGQVCISRTGLSPAVATLSCVFRYASLSALPAVLQPRALPETAPVWALARSLATTCAIVIYFLFLRVLRCFSSPGSLWSLAPVSGSLPTGFPIRTSAGHRAFAPHRGFSQLITSFFASESHRHPPCALVRFLLAFNVSPHCCPAHQRLTIGGGTVAYIRLARFFRFLS